MKPTMIPRSVRAIALILTTGGMLVGCGQVATPEAEAGDGGAVAGLSCWDVNGNGELDPDEDLDGDGVATVADCTPAGDSAWTSAGGGIMYDGKVGIGTMPTSAQLQVAGTVDAEGFSINGVPLSTSSDTYWSADENANISYGAGRVGIGTSEPAANLDVAGTLRVGGGEPGEGKVLTSDDQGVASWRTPYRPQVMWVKGTSDTSINTTNWTDLAEMSITMTTTGRPVVVQFFGNQYGNGDYRLMVDDVEKIQSTQRAGASGSLNFGAVLPAGTHVFKIQWRKNGDAESMDSASVPVYSRALLVMEL